MSQRGWNEAGAARAAREMRAATVRYLRTSPTARYQEAINLQHGLAIQARTYNRAVAPVMVFGGLGYEPPYPASPQEAADMVVSDEAEYLAGGELYVVEPNMMDVAVAAALTLTREDLELLSPDDLPSPTGVLVLPNPLLVRTTGGEIQDLRAVTWHSPMRMRVPSLANPQGNHDAVRISGYNDTYGGIQTREFRQFLEQQRMAGDPLPPLMLDGIRGFPFRHKPSDLDAFRRGARAASELNADLDRLTPDFESSQDVVEAEYRHGAVLDNHDGLMLVKFLYAFWRLCEQRISVEEPAHVSHTAKVTSARVGVSPNVRIVRLRRAHVGSHDSAERKTRAWQHRWVVKMHKVRQWYPNLNQHKVLYRGPYVKGPEGKPLLGGETVRALVR